MATVWRAELRALAYLAAPLAFVQLNSNLTGTVDTALAGRLGELPLAATGLGAALFTAISVLAMAAGLGLEPLLAQAEGAAAPRRAAAWLWQGAYLALATALPLAYLAWCAARALPAWGVQPALAAAVVDYLRGRLPALPAVALVAVLRAHLQARHRTRPVVVSAVAMNVLNGALDVLLLFGDAAVAPLGLPPMGLPRLGVFGLGVASAVAVYAQLGMLAWAARRHLPRRLPAPHVAAMRHVLGIGGPAGAQLLAEVGIFAFVSVLAGRLGTAAMAAHQAALTLVSLSFAMCVGLGTATAVQVGRAVGARDAAAVRRASLCGVGLGGGTMALSALVMCALPAPLLGLLTADAGVIAAAAPLIRIAAFFQLADGLQVVAAGALRGAGITRWPFWANLLAHWGVGMPVALLLGEGLGLGAAGLWWGLTAGLAVVAVALGARLARLLAQVQPRAVAAVAPLPAATKCRGSAA